MSVSQIRLDSIWLRKDADGRALGHQNREKSDFHNVASFITGYLIEGELDLFSVHVDSLIMC